MSDMYHPTGDRLEAFVEGSLDQAELVVVESHLLGCTHCQAQVEEWRALFSALAGLPQLEPSAGFADRVMAGVNVVQQVKRRAAWEGVWSSVSRQAAAAASAAGGMLPKSTFGWSLATGLLALPIVVSAALLAWLTSSTNLTLQALLAYAGSQLMDGLRAAGTTAVTAAVQTDVAAWLVAQAGLLLENAGTAGIGGLLAAACGATVLSVWVLYRNLFRTPTRETNHATYSF
jgi:anti-sigma factor RsiW